MQKIAVRFVNGNSTTEYTYMTTVENLKVGDLLIAPARDSFAVVSFVRYITTETTHEATRVITQRVDTESPKEAQIKLERKKDILNQMKARRAELEEQTVWAMLAQNDPKMAELLALFNSI